MTGVEIITVLVWCLRVSTTLVRVLTAMGVSGLLALTGDLMQFVV